MAMSRSIRSRSSGDNSDWAAEGDTVLSSHWAYRTHQLQRAGAGSVVPVGSGRGGDGLEAARLGGWLVGPSGQQQRPGRAEQADAGGDHTGDVEAAHEGRVHP